MTRASSLTARRARPADVPAIHRLIAHYAAQGLLLPRSEAEVRAHLAHFLVAEDRAQGEPRVAGCVALEPYGAELAEVRSLAVDPALRSRGAGARLLRHALAVARRRKVARVFAVTHAPKFFARQGFAAAASRQDVPEKVSRDCAACPRQRACELVAVVAVLRPERAALRGLTPALGAAALKPAAAS